jgi:hypothetical protein
MDLTIRASTRIEDLIPAARQEIRSIDRALPITRMATADSRLSERLDARRFESKLLGVFPESRCCSQQLVSTPCSPIRLRCGRARLEFALRSARARGRWRIGGGRGRGRCSAGITESLV